MKRFGRFLLRTRRGRLISGLLVVGAIVAVTAVAFGGSGRSSLSDSVGSSQEGCTTGPAGAEVRVTIYGGGQAECAAFDRAAARASEQFWHVMPAATEEAGRALVCSMAKEDLTLEVRDTGEHFYGNKICARLTAQGWHEQEGPGGVVERERETHEAEAKAAVERREAEERAQQQRQQAAEERKRDAEEHAEDAKEAEREHQEEVHEHEEQAREEAQQHQEEASQHEQEARERQMEASERAAEDRHSREETERSAEEAKQADQEAAGS
jgi:flagellar biosynthesis GTPase FlhF